MRWRMTVLPVVVLLLAGCSSPAPAETVTATVVASPTVEVVRGEDIVSVPDAVAWADGLDPLTNQGEVSRGLTTIGELVPTLNLPFDVNNDIGQEIIDLNPEVLSSTNSADVVPRVKALVARLEAEVAR